MTTSPLRTSTQVRPSPLVRVPTKVMKTGVSNFAPGTATFSPRASGSRKLRGV